MNTIKVKYKNYRGEIAIRTVTPLYTHFGTNDFHDDGEQFFLRVIEERGFERDFALKDCDFTTTELPS